MSLEPAVALHAAEGSVVLAQRGRPMIRDSRNAMARNGMRIGKFLLATIVAAASVRSTFAQTEMNE